MRNLVPEVKEKPSVDLVIQFEFDSAKLLSTSKPLLINLSKAINSDSLKTYVPYVTKDPLKILKDKVIALNLEINGIQTSLTNDSGRKLGKIAAGKIINTFEIKVKEFVAEVGKFTPMALAYIEPIEKFYQDKEDKNEQERIAKMTPEARAAYLAHIAGMAKAPTGELIRGGTRKKRHHSYPLKHTFKNRRV